jgi:hypothetical protein
MYKSETIETHSHSIYILLPTRILAHISSNAYFLTKEFHIIVSQSIIDLLTEATACGSVPRI